jgi:hypothetical protein
MLPSKYSLTSLFAKATISFHCSLGFLLGDKKKAAPVNTGAASLTFPV